ncbi:MAG: hypothetical protein ACYCVD_04050 [Desulfitobacteriaceae bacterium]
MPNLEKQRKLECFQADCKYAEIYCLVYHGNGCAMLGGTKIPVQRDLNAEAKKVPKKW